MFQRIILLACILSTARGFNLPRATPPSPMLTTATSTVTRRTLSTRMASTSKGPGTGPPSTTTSSTSLGLRSESRRTRAYEWISRRVRLPNQPQTTFTTTNYKQGLVFEEGEQEYVEEKERMKEAITTAISSATVQPSIEKEEKTASEKEGGGATIASSTMNLVKTILGTGVLALPSGVAACSNMPIALVPASALMLVLGVMSAYTFQLYGRLTHETQANSMGEVWEKTVGKKTSWVISAGTFSFCFGCALVYALVIGDFMSSLAMSLGSAIPPLLVRRQFWILGVTLSTLVPLSNLKSLAALAPMSILGTVGTILTTIFMAIRCPAIVASSPYSVAPVGKFAAAAIPSLAPEFGSFSKILSPAALIIASMATTAYLGHFNAPDFYNGFKQRQQQQQQISKEEKQAGAEEVASFLETDTAAAATTTNEASNEKAMKDYGKMAIIGFAGCTLMNIIIMSLGFLTFGGNSAGVILNNYATADKGAVISRLLMTLSVIGGYPFMVGGCKAGVMQIYNNIKKGKADDNSSIVEKSVGNAVIAIATALALVVNDAGLVVSLVGALMGSSIIYVFPTLMFLAHTGKQIQAAGGTVSRKLKLERFTSRFLTTFGIVSGLMGAVVAVINSVAPHLLR